MRIPHSDAFRDLVTQLLQKEPSDRLGSEGGVDQILAHEWFKEVNVAGIAAKQVEPVARDSFFRDKSSLKYFDTIRGAKAKKIMRQESQLTAKDLNKIKQYQAQFD